LQICKSLTKRQIQCFNNVGCHGFEFATPYRALPSFVNDPLSNYTLANIKQKSLHGRYFKELEQPEINIQASQAWLKKSNIHAETEGFIFAIQDRVI
jgi:hypothetical protein